MTKAHRDRGVATERMVANYLRAHGFDHAERAVKTGLKTIDREVADPGDITGTPGLVWQVKALKPLTRAEREVPGWMHETERQRRDAAAEYGILVVRRDQRPVDQWFAFLPLVDLYALGGLTSETTMPDCLVGDRDPLVAWPARLFLGDLVTLLRCRGWGRPLDEPSVPATPAAVPS